MNGFVISYNEMPVYWKWFNRITPTTWILQALASDQLGDVQTQVTTFNGAYSQPSIAIWYIFMIGLGPPLRLAHLSHLREALVPNGASELTLDWPSWLHVGIFSAHWHHSHSHGSCGPPQVDWLAAV